VQGAGRLLSSWGVVLMLVCVGAFTAAPAFAKLPRTYQVTRVDSPDPRTNDRFGDSLINAGWDINGDGPDDMVVGIGRGGAIKGKVLVLSGADGSLIREIPAPSDDVDGNGTENEGTTGDPDAPTGFGAAIASIADMGRCTHPVTFEPGGAAGENCNTAIVSPADQNTGDGVPEIIAAAVGLDIATEGDDRGAVFVIDGDTGAILKRLRAPDSEATTDIGFGRAVLSPGGESACAGTGRGGVSRCLYGGATAVQNGDIDDQGKPDIVVAAPDYSDTAGTNPACSDGAGGGTCSSSGRVYIFYGERLAAFAPHQYPTPPPPPDPPPHTVIMNPFAQHDDPALEARFHSEEMGLGLAPVGDIGSCRQSGAPGTACPDGMRSLTPDGKPEFTISVPRADAGAVPDAGLAFVIDGASGLRLDTYGPVDAQPESLFGFSNSSRPAIGEVGGADVLPDIYVPAIGQTHQFAGQGAGYVFGGSNQGSHLISTLNDPTPAKFGNFGTAAAGIGDVARAEVGLDSRNEILVGAFGESGAGGSINDVQIMSPLTDQVLQTIGDPDQQAGSGFGRGLASLGDVNTDGMLDFAVGAPGFDTTTQNNRGRIYLFLSDDSPLPPPPPPPQQQQQSNSPGKTPTTAVLAGRNIEIEASRSRITAGTQVTLRGVIDAFTNEVRCERNQSVEIQRRRRGTALYRTLTRVRTNGGGSFRLKIKPQATYYYRARLSQSAYCIGAVSPREQVTVRRKSKAARHKLRKAGPGRISR
jgi:FG-GAP repeat